MGLLQPFDDRATAVNENDDVGFTSRVRISFTATGETDHGLSFGGSIRADNAAGGAAGTAGSVFLSGGFGRITMGDTNGAAEAAVGDVAGVGLTGLGDLNETTYLSNLASQRPTLRYDYTVSGFGVHVSVGQPTSVLTNPLGLATAVAFDDPTQSIAFTYALDGIKLGLGFETTGNLDHIVVGGSYTIAGFTLAANYGELSGAIEATQSAGSVSYAMDALTVSAFYSGNGIRNALTTGAPAATAFPSEVAYGIGARYDLGGGASIRGGWATNDSRNQDAFDLGVNFTF